MSVIRRCLSEPVRNIDRNGAWEGEDKGLIKCWELGRQLSQTNPKLAVAACRNELPVTHWKGGVSRKLKKLEKYGSLHYLAQWQGLRSEDLEIDTTAEVKKICAKTGMIITFTADLGKLAVSTQDEPADGDAEHGGHLPGI